MTEIIEKLKNTETAERWNGETSGYFKPFQKIGGLMAVSGVALKIAGVIFPGTMPVALISLAPEIISIGITIYTGARLTKKQPGDKAEPVNKSFFKKLLDLI